MSYPAASHQGKPMACPVCNEPLHAFGFHNIELDICQVNQCGIWFDQHELSAVELSDTLENIDQAFEGEYKTKSLDKSFSEGERCCPRDGSILEKYHWNLGSGIVFDRCREDQGIWVDSGELEGYANYVKRFRAKGIQASPELKKQLAQIETERNAQYDQALVPWDFGLLDDMLRGLTKLVSRS